jgi:hypothetical protein
MNYANPSKGRQTEEMQSMGGSLRTMGEQVRD